MEVPTLEEFNDLKRQVDKLTAELKQVRELLPAWVKDEEAQHLTGLSRTQLWRERKKLRSPIKWKATPSLRYERASLIRYNESKVIRYID